mmetsp:Transcript_52982/g.105298  ORF Transcript_52982/g.105298 Transcript_52982/m.105298 type:complete len:233 (-) Transcript_52982:417-1115(-)
MYNGIGLASVRGSGTNGYVQKNMAHVSRQRQAIQKSVDKARDHTGELSAPKRANTDIVDHNRKRAIEVKVLDLRESLEAKGVPEEQIEERAEALRRSMLAKLPPAGASGAVAGGRAGETHADAARKEAETTALKNALGISSSYQSGSAFDRELQEREKQMRRERREAAEAADAEREAQEVAAREAMEEELEREKRREEKRQRKEARREEKEKEREERREEKRRKRKGADDDD